MLDGIARRLVDPLLEPLAARLSRRGVDADALTFAGLFCGLACALAVAMQAPMALALALLALGRIADGLDGAVARRTAATDRGGFLDIVCDFTFYGAVPLAFAVRDPEAALAACLLLFAFYVNGATFLAYAAVAAGRGLDSRVRGPKSIHFTAGLAEGTETIVVFAAMIAWPPAFPALAIGFAVLCLVTAAARGWLAWRTFAVDKRGGRLGGHGDSP